MSLYPTEKDLGNAAKVAFVIAHKKQMDAVVRFKDDDRWHSVTLAKVVKAIPTKLFHYVDTIDVDDEGIWIGLKEEYDFDDCGLRGGMCHASTLAEVKACFKNGIILHK